MSKFHTTSRIVGGDESNYTAEARLVQSRAERGEPSVIRLNDIVFFSTTGGDAWMFDAKEGEAACLARAGRPQAVPLEETDRKLLVTWQADCRIEDDTFTVIERDGSTCSFIDYPIEEIRNLLAAPPDDAPAHSDQTFRLAPDVKRRLDELWREFDAHRDPTTEQMDALLGQLLALPPEATDWCDLLHCFARHEHADLPGVFRRIAAQVLATKDTGLGFVCWAALEEFTERERVDLMPEIVAVCRQLNGGNYDADAMHHVREYALAAGCEAEALALAEHFLPILRADPELMGWTVPAACGEIFELRVGGRLRAADGTADNPDALARELRRDLEEEIDTGYAAHAARVICCGGSAVAWTKTDFDLTDVEGVDDSPEWRATLRRLEALMQVAREAGQFDGHPPGCAFHELQLLVNATYDERDAGRGKRKRKEASANLLDCLHGRIESRVARSSQGFLGTDVPHARLLLNAHRHLLRFAQRHRLIAAEVATRAEHELDRLQTTLRP